MSANIQSQTVTSLYNYPKFWAECYDPAPFLPMSRAEMDALGWDACDIILITGDAYIEKLANSPELRMF